MNEYASPVGAALDSPDSCVELFKELGQKISQLVRQDGQYLSPLLAAFTARVITLEQHGRFPVDGPDAVPVLPKAMEDELIRLTIQRALSTNDPHFETIKMQLTFESFYALELRRLRREQDEEDHRTSAMLDAIIQVGSSLTSSHQVATLYRMLFKLLLFTSTVPEPQRDRAVEREIAVALESVFPQAGLNAFSLCAAEQKRQQVLNLLNVVLGVRLFNRAIEQGGAGLPDVPALVASELDTLYERLEAEAREMGDICFTLSDLCLLEVQKPGTLVASVERLQCELVNRRQYVLLLHQLQHEVLDAVETVKRHAMALQTQLTQLQAVVGLRAAVPKDHVYPLFHAAAAAWRALARERKRTAVRVELLAQLQQYRTSYPPCDVEADLPKLRLLSHEALAPLPTLAVRRADGTVDVSAFVETISDSDAGLGTQSSSSHSLHPQRLVRETTVNFLSLPLEAQGYCVWMAAHRGVLVPGDPGLGLLRLQGRHYCFSSYMAMHAFCSDPERVLQALVTAVRRRPALGHLLGVQTLLPGADIAVYLSLAEQQTSRGSGGRPVADAQTQKGDEHAEAEAGGAQTEWNEWRMREHILRMADLSNCRSSSTQTRLSHFRRDAATQTLVPQMRPDGSMPGTGTQTGITKATGAGPKARGHVGLRGHVGSRYRTVTVGGDDRVVEASNGDLRLLAAKVVARPIIKEV